MSNIDLLIINPAAAHGIYGELGDKLIALEPPQWCRILAGYARDRGFSVHIIDAEAERINPDAVAELAKQLDPQLTCIAVYGHQPSASTQQMFGARQTAEALRSACVGPVIMVGGHPSALPERTLREEPVDYVCKGEGPMTIVHLLSYLTGDLIGPRSVIPGLVWSDDGEVVVNKQAPLIDINELHGRAWDLLPMDLYRAHNWQCFGDIDKRQPYASIFTSLGCPYACSFCCINAPFDSHRYRMREPMAVVAEVVHLYDKYGIKTFKITDEMFVLNSRHYTAIAEGLINEGMEGELNIWAYARVDTVRADRLALLRRAGIRWLALGIESASAYVLDGADKRLKPRDIADVVDAIQQANINVIGNFIFGLPDDSEESMRETLTLAKLLHLDFANFYSAMAYPGSPLYDEAVLKGWALPTSWRGFSQHNDDCRPLDTQHVTAQRVLASRDAAFNEFFRDEDYLARMAQKFGRETEAHVREMTKYQLKRKLLEAA